MDDLKDILARRADELGVEKQDVMTIVKLAIVDMLRIEVRVISYKNGVMRIATEDSSAASELRLHARKILDQVNCELKDEKISFLSVVIR